MKKIKPTKKESDWFRDNQSSVDFKKASTKDLEKYYRLGLYYKDGASFIKDEDGTSYGNSNSYLVESNLKAVNQILNDRFARKSIIISLIALIVSIISLYNTL
jgi:hypothetical protein